MNPKTPSNPYEPPRLEYYTTQAGAMSFESAKVRHFVTQFIEPDDEVLNLCAGDTPLSVGNVVRNDVRESVDSEYHHDVRDLFEIVDETYDVVLYDPPFSLNQHIKTYGLPAELWPGYGEHIATGIESLLKPGGKAIQLGFHATIDPTGVTSLYPTAIATFQQLGRGYDWCACIATKADTLSQGVMTEATAKVHPNPFGRTNGSPSFDISYKRDRSEDLESVLATTIFDELDRPTGKTLALVWGDEPDAFASRLDERYELADGVFPYRGPQDRIITRSLGEGDKHGIEIHPEELKDHIPRLDYDTVIIWPPLAGWNWTIRYNDEECGYVRALKRTLDTLLGSCTTIYTVGRTMTGMRNAWEYEHEGVSLVDRVEDQACWFVSRFSKPQTGFGETQQSNTPVDIGYRETSATPRWITRSTRDTFYYNPALYVPCTQCGAHQNNHCVENGDIVSLHPERVEWFNEVCERTDKLRWFRNRRHGTVSTIPNHDFKGVATPSATTNTDAEDRDSPEKTIARTLEHYFSAESAT